MTAATIERWSAWSPGREDADAWRLWARTPEPLAEEGRPDASFLPAMLRRRCSTLARIMLTAAFDCCPEAERPRVRTVFASRHGNINESIDLLDRLARRQPLSPTRFSHTVHNAQAGLFSIAAGNRRASSSLSAQEDSFACAYLEALCHLERDPESGVLLVMADVPLDSTFAPLVEEPVASYGLALLLRAATDGQGIGFETATAPADAAPLAWPDAAEFLRWHLGDDPTLEIVHGRRGWRWRRPGRAH